ncbi:regulatory signaling modulator protein AmpE [Marinimicrobium sp. ABcell2]|uniref:regulatory signaling modulator protein AmpE n=1 Tax=Marinimicrobium sp. ABcell2 TaxID=3069751 RepID=UPI0027B264D2|nr:regulatory signaling modulator protein AmpE [Marinimicrobium sp. ABcell2]MDQ2078298.1 regulatory signaling modulator protein AmpE [Marinimicrobium sp. ABcell2]
MTFLSLIVALALVQWWGSGAPLQRDGWFFAWMDRLQGVEALNKVPGAYSLTAILVPCLTLWLLTWGLVAWLSPIWVFFIAVPVLLYSFGRGDFSAAVKAYLVACKREDSVAASQLLEELRGGVTHGTDADAEDWQTLNQQALAVISYRGFERMFAVLFWFVILGPMGALLYRLSLLYRERSPDRFVERWVWLLEWPVVRLMGLTWAMAGNFDTCVSHWKQTALNFTLPSIQVLRGQLLGALGEPAVLGEVDAAGTNVGLEEPLLEIPLEDPDHSRRLIHASLPLLSRSLLLWVCALALVTLLV